MTVFIAVFDKQGKENVNKIQYPLLTSLSNRLKRDIDIELEFNVYQTQGQKLAFHHGIKIS